MSFSPTLAAPLRGSVRRLLRRPRQSRVVCRLAYNSRLLVDRSVTRGDILLGQRRSLEVSPKLMKPRTHRSCGLFAARKLWLLVHRPRPLERPGSSPARCGVTTDAAYGTTAGGSSSWADPTDGLANFWGTTVSAVLFALRGRTTVRFYQECFQDSCTPVGQRRGPRLPHRIA